MHSFRCVYSICSLIIAIYCINVMVFAFANEHLNILNASQSQPCDRTRRIFTESHGEFSDGPAGYNYTQDSHCEWLIKAKNDSQFITLKFHSLATECSYDYLFVYDGDSMLKSPLIGSFSGKTDPQQVIATSGNMLIILYSDTNYVLNGFRAEYFISNCPNNCSGKDRGKCVKHTCVCIGDWISADCSVHACPDNCGVDEGRGVCMKEHCRCKNGYSGKSCSLHIDNNVENEWHYLASSYSGLTPRAAHSAVYVRQTDSLYVYGGYDLNNILGALQIYRFNKSTWEDELGISLRSRHFPAEWDNTLLKAILYQNEEEAKLWGLKNDASFFRNILLSISDENFLRRHQRSPKRNTKHSLNLNETISNQDISEFLEALSEKSHIGPMHRYGHAACAVEIEGGGFVIHGGKLENGSLANDLWFFNASAQQPEHFWTLRAVNSTLQLPTLTRHTITLVENYLYIFGGSLSNGEFSSRIFRIQLMDNPGKDQWEEVHARGGKTLDVRLVAHTTIYHKMDNSLIVYGGVVARFSRFSKLSDRIFAFHLNDRYWTEIHYPRMQLREAFIPRERAFHTATIIGNYMVVFGGYTHRHNKEEICYDNQMYLYHLKCHVWVNLDVLGLNPKQRYPKNQGVFAHAAAVRNDNTLLIVGGYHGNVNADLLAYTLPSMLQIKKTDKIFDPENHCHKHTVISECLSDLDCGWCSVENICSGRTFGANCTTNLLTGTCPGICPALGSCHACLIHGNVNRATTNSTIMRSFVDKTGLNHCQWCVQNARCHHKADNFGTCGSSDDTPSQEIGFWGTNGIEIDSAKHCSRLDKRPGLTFLKYYSPINWTIPDEVSIVNATTLDFLMPSPTTKTEHDIHRDVVVARLHGFIRPPKKWIKNGEQWQLCASHSKALLEIGSDVDNYANLRIMGNLTASDSQCQAINWTDMIHMPEDLSLDPLTENSQMLTERLLIDLRANRSLYSSGPFHPNLYHTQSKIRLQHNGTHDSSAFTFEYLETFSNGDCERLTNCLECLSDAMCGWCDISSKCLLRTEDEELNCARTIENSSYNNKTSTEWNYFIVETSQCSNCSDFITCESCLESRICEYWPQDARCSRIGRSKAAVKTILECPSPCNLRTNCSSCLDEEGRCVWCSSTSTCFSFSVYTSEYQFGICREWLDQTISLTIDPHEPQPRQPRCKSCESHKSCTECIQYLNCGWCFDRDNPIDGICMQGDFNGSIQNCDAVLYNNTVLHNTKLIPGESEYAYAQCPDVDECGLGLHNCHVHARCINTPESFDCFCRRGFVGDGFTTCVKTCYEQCTNGYCSGAPEYRCICDLGWTGASCSISCGCNNHSTCSRKGPGICDECQHWTEGDSCERCRPGSYGNATSIAHGCKPCECNGHGNSALGVCDIKTGECFCRDNTEGMNCEQCSENYYGNPTNNGQCFFQCESRGMLKQIGGIQGIGSYQSHKTNFGPEVRDCLWIISPYMSSGSQPADNFIQFEIQTDSSFNVTCAENSVYVYDGLPDLIGHSNQRQLLGVFCSEETKYYTVEARSGHLTIHYKQSVEGQGFNAIYTVRSCTAGTCLPPRVCNEENQCVCSTGFTGVYCEIEICPRNCSNAHNQGKCDIMYGRCLCEKGFGGPDCSISLKFDKSLIITELFNSQLITDSSLDHLRKTLPRFGHSLVSDKRGNLWLFGGYSLHHKALNDIRQFDTRNSSWIQVTVDGSSDAKMPQGRYLHSADIHGTDIFVYGGMTDMSKKSNNSSQMVLDDFFKFSIIRQSWIEVDIHGDIRPPPLVGHTLTLIRDHDHDVLLLIGGFSPSNGFNHLVYAFNLTTAQWNILKASGTSPIGIFGHTAVFHSISKSVYVFGGYAFQPNGKNEISNRLFALNIAVRMWSEIPIFSGINKIEQKFPRALHSAISTDNYMLVYGGKTQNTSDFLNAYVYSCNMWIRLTENVDIVGQLRPSYAQGMAYDAEAVYIVTGWDGSIISRVIRIDLPNDLCQLFKSSKHLCRSFMGCSYCTVRQHNDISKYDRNTTVSHCFSSGRTDICTEQGDREYNNGILCDANAILKRSCSDFNSCESCTAVWSNSEIHSPCLWCQESNSVGHCLPLNRSDHCGGSLEKISSNDMCPATRCNGDCEICTNQTNCRWEQSPDTNTGSCLQIDDSSVSSYQKQEQICSSRCNSYKNCSSCLFQNENCRWSTQLDQCISIEFQPLICGVGGICGLVLQPKEISYCPESCSIHTSCSVCLRHAHCGWCSKSNNTDGAILMGDGVCTEGSLESPSESPEASTCDIIYANQKNVSINPIDEFNYNYVTCPPENECIQPSHHTCDPRSERCIDKLIGYECECADGFETISDSISRNLITDAIDTESDEMTLKCIPKCSKGCVYGRCTEPDVCSCDFGYTGLNCSIQCQCNGHSSCQGPQDLNVCLECKNNTIGEQCEKCKPLFVGDPRNNGACVACVDYCHGHTDLCVDRTANVSIKNMNRNELLNTLTQGPQSDALCLRCQNKTTNDRCEGCIFGHFRGAEDYKLPCRKCHCQGHGETCSPVLGDGCDCHNNTESDTTCSANQNSAQQCWMFQCSKCRETYTGNPLDGHQCYKQLTVESKMCFDAKTIDECKKPTPLKNGQTVFFVIQPRFMNVDIRIIVDVTQGELNLYLSPQDDALVVENSPDASHHDVYFDGKYHWLTDSELIGPIDVAKEKVTASSSFDGNFSYGYNRRKMKSDITHDCSPLNLNSLFVKDVHAKDLSTYVTLNKCNTMLRVYNLKNRLCIQLAHHIHNLSQTRFYIALKAVNGPASYGLIFFRQDQLHIDLFVFFSVFFSCFFLFLAVCVVIWKFKMAANVRQERIRHVNEMLHMAKRPFASIQLSVSNTGTPPRRRALRSTNAKHFLATASHQNIRPIAIEPTADNCSAVCTVFIRLPSNGKSSPTVALGSALVVMNSRQFPAYQRIPYIKRRRISGGPGTSNDNNTSGPSSPAHFRPQAPIQLRMHRERRNINLNQVI